MAAVVGSLTKEQHGAAVRRRLCAQQPNTKIERVKNGRARIAIREGRQLLGCRIRVRGEVLFDARLAVKSDHSNAMWHAANHCVEYRPQVAIVTQVCRTLTSGLHDDGQRQGLPERAIFNPHRLRNAIICQDEIFSRERKNNLGRLGLYQYRHEHQIGAGRERRNLRSGGRLYAALGMDRRI